MDPTTGRVFVAHTAFGTVEVVEPGSPHGTRTIEGCTGASGVLCADAQRLVFAASRGSGKVLAIHADRLLVIGELTVGPKPNGLAWDAGRGRLLVADVDPSDQTTRLIQVSSSELIATTDLPGRPRWCIFDEQSDRFLVNIREPACLISLSAASGEIAASWPISSRGPHGLGIDPEGGRAFVACDGGRVIVLDLATGTEVASIGISGEPDAIWFNQVAQRLYVGIGDPGVVDVIDTGRLSVIESIRTEPGCTTSALDGARQCLYVFLPESCAAAVYDQT